MSLRVPCLALLASLTLPVAADAAKLKHRRFPENGIACLSLHKLTALDVTPESELVRESRPFGLLSTRFTYRVTLRGTYNYESYKGPGPAYRRVRQETFHPDRFALQGRSSARSERHPRHKGPLRSITELRLHSSRTDVDFAFGYPLNVSVSFDPDHHIGVVHREASVAKGTYVGSLIGSGQNATNAGAGDGTGLRRISIRSGVSAGKGDVNPYYTNEDYVDTPEEVESPVNHTIPRLHGCDSETRFTGPE